MSVSPEYSQSLRLCHITKWSHFDGYGFNLHAEKGKQGHYIGKVDDHSPAEAAGLKRGDRIIEVNGANAANENHKEVVNRIKAVSDHTVLLVVDSDGDAYFKANNIELNSSLPFVVRKKTPVSNNVIDNDKSATEPENETETEKPLKKDSTDTTAIDLKQDLNNVKSQEKVISSKPSSEPPNQVVIEKPLQNTLNLNMTAKELRAQLAARKKYDPKKDYSLDAKKKYDIVQKL